MEKLLEIVSGVNVQDVPAIVYGYGVKKYGKLYGDYQRNLAFSGDLVEKLVDKKALGYKEEFPGGYGIMFQNSEELSFYGQFVNAVISKELSLITAPLRGDDALDQTDPENDEEVMNINRTSAKLRAIKTEIQSTMMVKGNNIRNYFQLDKFVKIEGDDKGDVKMWISVKPITEDNGGEYLGKFPNACDDKFSVSGEIKGLQGAVNAISSNHFANFHVDGDNLYIWESFFAGGKVKFKENLFGKLVG